MQLLVILQRTIDTRRRWMWREVMRSLRERLNAVLDSALDQVATSVLVAVVSHIRESGDEPRAWPGLERLCWQTKYSRSAVKRSLAKLKDLGVLEPCDVAIGTGCVVGYITHLEKLPRRSPYRPGTVFRRGSQGTLYRNAEGVQEAFEKGSSTDDERGSQGARIEDLSVEPDLQENKSTGAVAPAGGLGRITDCTRAESVSENAGNRKSKDQPETLEDYRAMTTWGKTGSYGRPPRW